MTDAVIIALIGSVTTTIAAVITAVVSVRISKKADKLVAKTDEIHTLTNSNFSRLTAELKAANDRLSGFEKRFTGPKPPTI